METAGTLEGIQRYTIHGQPYLRVFYSHPDAPETMLQAQLPADAVDETVRPGDPITVTYLLKTVMRIAARRANEPDRP